MNSALIPDPKPTAGALLILALCFLPAVAAQRIKLACIGDSITRLGYPDSLQSLLPNDTIVNAGDDGCTASRNSDKPYWTDPKFAWVFGLQPDIVTIMLGTNDSRDINWPVVKDHFGRDYRALVDTVIGMASKPKVWLVIPTPAFSRVFGINDTILTGQIIPIIKAVAQEKNLPLIDFRTPMLQRSGLLYDGVHPTGPGCDTLAALMHQALAGSVSVLKTEAQPAPGIRPEQDFDLLGEPGIIPLWRT